MARKKPPNTVIPSEARNPSFFLPTTNQEGFLASLGMTN
jgi:hypothetical protein